MVTLNKVWNKVRKKTHATSSTMSFGRFQARLMQAERLVDRGSVHGLPPGKPVDVMPVDALPGCPKDWVRGQGAYVCPVSTDVGLWFDWTMNDDLNTSILTSVKGMNPITGRKIESLLLEQYNEKCPVHEVAFEGPDRFCPKCEYKWPCQNYVASPNILWLDGWKQPDGTIRQFFFTEDEKRDIASLVIGKANTVPAFGFVFYEPVKRRERPARDPGILRSFGSSCGLGLAPSNDCYWYNTSIVDDGLISSQELTCGGIVPTFDGAITTCNAGTSYGTTLTTGIDAQKGLAPRGRSMEASSRRRISTSSMLSRTVADVSVGAGAQIRQDIARDPLGVSEWKAEPSAMMRLYFVFAEQFDEIVKNGGVKDLDGDEKGFLKDLPVG